MILPLELLLSPAHSLERLSPLFLFQMCSANVQPAPSAAEQHRHPLLFEGLLVHLALTPFPTGARGKCPPEVSWSAFSPTYCG